MQKLVPHLWYDSDAETAARRYAELVPGSAVGSIVRYPEAGRAIHGREPGSVMTVGFRLGDTDLVALNGGPLFKFTPATSLFVVLGDEAALDRLWEGLIEGGTALMPLDRYGWSERYGWLADRWRRERVMALCAAAATLGQLLVPLAVGMIGCVRSAFSFRRRRHLLLRALADSSRACSPLFLQLHHCGSHAQHRRTLHLLLPFCFRFVTPVYSRPRTRN